MDIAPEDLTIAIQETLQTFAHGVETAVDKAAEQTGKDTVAELKSSGPVMTGRYRRSWRMKKDKKGAVTVYNAKYYRLTHLLEHGHVLRRNGRVIGRSPALPHIAAAEEKAEKEFTELIKANIEKGD